MHHFHIYFSMEYNINQHIKGKGWKITHISKYNICIIVFEFIWTRNKPKITGRVAILWEGSQWRLGFLRVCAWKRYSLEALTYNICYLQRIISLCWILCTFIGFLIINNTVTFKRKMYFLKNAYFRHNTLQQIHRWEK